MSYIKQIIKTRIENGETQEDMAELLQTTQQQISKYERQKQELPIRHLITLCKHWGVSADYLLCLRP